MTRIAVQMVQRLRRLSQRDQTRSRPLTLALLPASNGVEGFGARLAAAFAQHGATLHLSRTQTGTMPLTGDLDASADAPDAVAWMNAQEQHHRVIVYEADAEDTAWTRRCLQQCDRVLVVARAAEQPHLASIQALLARSSQPHVRPRTEMALLHPDMSQMPHNTNAWLTLCPIEQHYHIADDQPAHVERLVRFLTGRALGLVLGAGGMRGSTHIGVIRALAELGITPDAVGGCSAGALIAAQVALGWTPQRMLDEGERELVAKNALRELTLPLVAFNSGKRLSRAFHTMLGDVKIEDLWMPYFCISGNMTTAQMEVHQRGPLWRYVRASTALPGIYPPVLDENGDLLVDGSIFNNVPADVMRRVVGNGTVIAVDVGRELSGKRNFRFGDSVSGWSLLLQRLNPFGRKQRVPGIIRILTRTTALNGLAARPAQVAQADLLLKPPIEDFGLFDMKGYRAIHDIGYRDTLNKAREWGSGVRG
jgi:predicted acylesterase/phospholipase RssA